MSITKKQKEKIKLIIQKQNRYIRKMTFDKIIPQQYIEYTSLEIKSPIEVSKDRNIVIGAYDYQAIVTTQEEISPKGITIDKDDIYLNYLGCNVKDHTIDCDTPHEQRFNNLLYYLLCLTSPSVVGEKINAISVKETHKEAVEYRDFLRDFEHNMVAYLTNELRNNAVLNRTKQKQYAEDLEMLELGQNTISQLYYDYVPYITGKNLGNNCFHCDESEVLGDIAKSVLKAGQSVSYKPFEGNVPR